jgi:PHD/YefM family antitoxin component YafN of YafNO toxin-antitoxin module
MNNQFITDSHGRKKAIILPIRDFEKMMDKIEELEDIKAYDEAINNDEEAISAEQAFLEIESKKA